jgi:phosphatidate phosphatase APP1
VRGRVTERKAVSGTTERSSVVQNVLDTIHRLDSDEIPGARVRARFQGRTWEATTDQEGYFAIDVDPPQLVEAGWHDVELELVETIGKPLRRTEIEPVLVPSVRARFGVISDIDDTIIASHSNDFIEQVAVLFGSGARERVVIPGMPALYRALVRGAEGDAATIGNPIFYVSRSSWNLYDLFEEFLEVNRIPPGPLFLTDQRVIEEPSRVMGGSGNHKFARIHELLRTYPTLPFILVGDSGMLDPEVYEGIVENHPGRILAVYIRDVSGKGRDREVQRIGESLEAQGVPMVRMVDAREAAEHAAARGWIDVRGLAEVREALDEPQEIAQADASDG